MKHMLLRILSCLLLITQTQTFSLISGIPAGSFVAGRRNLHLPSTSLASLKSTGRPQHHVYAADQNLCRTFPHILKDELWKKVCSGCCAVSLSLFLISGPACATEAQTASGVTAANTATAKDAEHKLLDEVLNTVEDHFLDLSNQKGVADSTNTKTFNGLAWSQIRKQFDEQQLRDREDTYAKIKQLLPKLGDKYTRFITPSEFAKFTKYDLTGVGILFIEKEGKIYIAGPPLAGSTGAEAGLQKGDRLVTIDGVPVEKKSIFDITESLTGQTGTKINLRVERNGGAPFDVTLERKISVKSSVKTYVVTAKDNRLVGYIKLSEFNAGSRKGVADAVAELREVGVNDIVLDLRGNPGGVLEGALQIASLFLTDSPPAVGPAATAAPSSATAAKAIPPGPAPAAPAAASPAPGGDGSSSSGGGGAAAAGANAKKGGFRRTLVYVVDRNGKEDSVRLPAWGAAGPAAAAEAAALDPTTPLVIIMDKRSASASEVLAGALRDNCRAVVVGSTPSYGKGLIQGAFPLSDGSGVVVTVAKYLTPRHAEIQGIGVVPDLRADIGPGRAAIRSGRLDLAEAERRLSVCVPPPAAADGAAAAAAAAGGQEQKQNDSDRRQGRLDASREEVMAAAPAAGLSLMTLRAWASAAAGSVGLR